MAGKAKPGKKNTTGLRIFGEQKNYRFLWEYRIPKDLFEYWSQSLKLLGSCD